MKFVSGEFYATDHAVTVETLAETNPSMIYWFMVQMNLNQYATSTAQPGLSVSTINEISIPLPPWKEQNRIVREIERLLSLIDDIDIKCCEINDLIENTKSKILSLAIQGKLVPQNTSDEPAAKLLKGLSPSWEPSDKSHYQSLPNGWTICKLEDVIDYEQPQNYIVSSTNYADEFLTPVLTAGKSFIIGYTNETNGIFTNVPVIIFDDFTTDSKYVDFPFKVKSSAMKILHVKNGINIRFIFLIMSATRLVGDTHKRYWISEYSQIPILLPPLSEQNRIVQTVDEYFKRLDEIRQLIE